VKLKHIALTKLEIPFRVSFKHASAERTTTEAVIAKAHSESGVIGYGEGCPRSYVTGETMESCMDFVEKYRADILQIENIGSLSAFVSDHAPVIDKSPSAWCAIETAILDLLGKIESKSIEAVIGIPEVQGSFYYTAVLGVSNPKVFAAQLARYIQIGFHDFKIKISGKSGVDASHIAAIRTAMPRMSVARPTFPGHPCGTRLICQ
jgi:L-alanine-DL-glutamate epimerase-like enolase superfamily enzyme